MIEKKGVEGEVGVDPALMFAPEIKGDLGRRVTFPPRRSRAYLLVAGWTWDPLQRDSIEDSSPAKTAIFRYISQ
jgi:hypothetical protein